MSDYTRIAFVKRFYPTGEPWNKHEKRIALTVRRSSRRFRCAACGREIPPFTEHYMEAADSIDRVHLDCAEIVE